MTELNWNKIGEADPVRVRKEDIPDQMSDRDIVNFRKQIKRKYQAPKGRISRTDLAEVLTASSVKTLKTVSDRIKVVRKTGKPDANDFIRETAITTMQHAEATGDCGHALNLVAALPSSTRQMRLAEWISKFSPICFGRGKKGGLRAFLRKEGSSGMMKYDYFGARRTPFK